MKAYCLKCIYFDYDRLLSPECNKEIEYIDTPFKQIITHKIDPQDKNKFNNCKDYKSIKIMTIFRIIYFIISIIVVSVIIIMFKK